ncbi:hypothetical protein BCY89_05735 [Sphingobacterium siyangense]|uniref:Thioredoxin domain-containing protein n=1 Tax=Sphingobacterium siyangense TaxID=459529 RepID=A0A420FW30_9SPHI|nr:TlpA disulfide reductase family protein [Sphingobacterium siyangense]RKF37152.1 hypothetical protein BCY89_05735 [Sphingobacterium siyangense]
MKKNILLIILSCFCYCIYGQIKTKITGFIPDFKDSVAIIEFQRFYPFDISDNHRVINEIKTNSGKFEFIFDLSEPNDVALNINNRKIFFPGSSGIDVNPGDSIHILIPDSRKLGILDLEISGRGSERINIQKEVDREKLALYKIDPPYWEQSIGYKFSATDKKLRAIDSVLHIYKNQIKKEDRDLIRADQYFSVLNNLLVACLDSKSDSLRNLFNEYMVKKNWMEPFFSGNSIYYGANYLAIRDYILLAEYKNPHDVGGGMFRKKNPVEYCKLILKYLSHDQKVREYLLAQAALIAIQYRQDSKESDEVYQIFSDNVVHDSPFYGEVTKAYQIVQSRLKKGMPFYTFSLRDTTGKMYHLADFRGKILLLDFWFNGCGGCRQMAPVIEKLEKEYLGKDIQFISVSIDSNEKLWRRGIGKYCSKSSLQLYTEGLEIQHPLIKYVNPGGYPFLVAIDKKGNLIGIPPDPRASPDSFKRFIDQYL